MEGIGMGSITVSFDYVGGNEIDDIRRCLGTLFQTPEGSCPLDRDFGINMDIVSLPPDVAENLFAVEITTKTERYEPRAIIKTIRFGFTADGQMDAEVIITNV